MKFLLMFLLALAPFLDSTSAIGVMEHAFLRSAWTKEEITRANTAGGVKYLTPEERDFILYTNLIRLDGERFLNTFFEDFMKSHNQQMRQYSNYDELKISKSNKYYKSLQRDLKDIKNLPMLWPDEALSWVARQHAREMNKYNYAAHKSRDGRGAKERIHQMYPKRSMGENLSFGFASGLGNACMLLLDKNVPDLGHRKLILNTDYKLNFVGVSIQPHKGYRYCAVMDFVALPR